MWLHALRMRSASLWRIDYRDFMKADPVRWIKEAATVAVGSHDTPAAFALFPADISAPPREWAERFFNVQRWTEMKSGGQFAAMEEPVKLAVDIRAFLLLLAWIVRPCADPGPTRRSLMQSRPQARAHSPRPPAGTPQ